jgi:hypothetical protein
MQIPNLDYIPMVLQVILFELFVFLILKLIYAGTSKKKRQKVQTSDNLN